ncbi:MAG TPA: hypothetical protein VIV84_04305, partial [Burkholderiaceae bacterium]
TAMFNPLPAIALLPVAMLWFGIGERSLIFVLVHAVLWPLALNALQGFTAVPETLRLVGRNYALSGASGKRVEVSGAAAYNGSCRSEGARP